MNSCSKVFFFFIPPLSCFGSLLWSVFSSLLLLDLVPNLMCSRGKHVSKGACLNAGKCIIAVIASNLGIFLLFCLVRWIASKCVHCWWRQACGSTARDPMKPSVGLSGLVSKAKCFFRSRYKDNLSQLPFSHAFPFSFTG